MIREQEHAVETLCLEQGGRLAIREGYLDKHVEASTPTGALWLIDEQGVAHRSDKPDWSVSWRPEPEPTVVREIGDIDALLA